MTNPEPSFTVNVDPGNPGQFFACCGLLELADRLWPGAEGWFNRGFFSVIGSGGLVELLSVFLMDAPKELTLLDNGLAVKELLAPLRFSFDGGATWELTLDAWMTIRTERNEVVTAANPPWNFWSGHQTPLRIWTSLRAAVVRQLAHVHPENLPDLFFERVLLSGRFGFDPGAAWNALDVGFSPNEQGIEVASSAIVELLAAVGIQRFRPRMAEDRQSFVYATWGRPLSPATAAAAAAAVVTLPPTTSYRGRVVSRGSYAALGYSTTLGVTDE